MIKIKVRCYRGFGIVGLRRNVEVYYTLPDFGYYMRLFTDLRTGEIYAATWECEITDRDFEQAIESMRCPITDQSLAGALTPYPQSFLFDGQIGHFEPNMRIPPDDESLVCEFWSIDAALSEGNPNNRPQANQ